jgi:hypothetical protein
MLRQKCHTARISLRSHLRRRSSRSRHASAELPHRVPNGFHGNWIDLRDSLNRAYAQVSFDLSFIAREFAMNMLLAFAPFIAFVVIERTVGVSAGLAAGAFVSAVMLVRDFLSRGRHVKILEIGTLLLFAALSLYSLIYGALWSAVRLRVDAGLFLIVLASIALRQPFTLQYVREKVASEVWNSPSFVRVNYAITFAWVLAFAAMVAADLLMTYLPSVPHSIGIASTVVALYAAVKFTGWYPQQQRAAPRS